MPSASPPPSAQVEVEVEVHATPAEVTAAAAQRIVAAAAAAIGATGRFMIALSGGTTPRALYELLATPAHATRIDWSRVHVFWADERCVPPDDPASNHHMARVAFLDVVPIPPAHVHRIHGEDASVAAAVIYEREVDAVSPGARPRFDLILLGMGADGHTASLFPGRTAVSETARRVVADYIVKASQWRVTMTPRTINAAAAVLFLVTGSEKAAALHQVLEGPRDPDRWPAQVVAPDDGRVTWLVDANAAALLTLSLDRARPRGPVAAP